MNALPLPAEIDRLRKEAQENAQQYLALGVQLEQAELTRDQLLRELGYIASAKRENFEDAEEFRAWAQNRARHAMRQAGNTENERDFPGCDADVECGSPPWSSGVYK